METLYEQERNDRKIKIAAIVGAILSVTLLAAGIMAYLTDTHVKSNKFTLDTNLSINVDVPGWSDTTSTTIIPTQTVNMQPTIRNNGSVDAWLAVKIEMPVFTGPKMTKDVGDAKVTKEDLYQMLTIDTTKWTRLNTETGDTVEPTTDNGTRTYTYVYNDMLAANTGFAKLFDQIRAINVSADQNVSGRSTNAANTNRTGDLKITAIAVQKSDEYANATEAYRAYQKQEAPGTEVYWN